MHETNRKHSTTPRKDRKPPARGPGLRQRDPLRLLRMPLCAGVACLLALLSGTSGLAAEGQQASVGEAYVLNQLADEKPGPKAGETLHMIPGLAAKNLTGVLDPSSQVWAGAQALSLRLERATMLLATNVIASAGDAKAAASHADGGIQLFGAGNCTSVAMPGGHPAYSLAIAKSGDVLAAWAQGVNRLVFFDLAAAGCPATSSEVPLRGQVSLSLSASGNFLAAQDEGGRLWVGPRGGELRIVTTLSGPPAAIGFSEGEGVLLVLDTLGRGGSWNPRNGKILRSLEVPGGPFAGGDFQGTEARLWTRDGRLVRWDVLHNRAAATAKASGEALSEHKDGWLELRGTDLYYARAGLSWRPAPDYEPHLPLLSYSRQADCLRLSDVDGLVRYFHAHTGQKHSQCFADDWISVTIQPDGTAQVPGLRLRIFDRLASTGRDSEVNVRAISEYHVVLWSETAPRLELSIEATPSQPANTLLKIVENPFATAMKPISVPLRQGIAADAPAQLLPLQ